jgi:hypothetical protein
MEPVRIFNLDLHISVIQDIQWIVQELYGPNIQITNWSISGHNWVFQNKNSANVDIITPATWHSISPTMISEFQTRYDSELTKYDAFLVTHTPVFCLLYEKYGKPVICVNSCRFDQPFCWKHDAVGYTWLVDGLRRMTSRGQLRIISNNKADAEYLKCGTGIISEVIPSLCLYTGLQWLPNVRPAICFGDRALFPESPHLVAKPPSGYTWAQLYACRAIVHVPYEMSTMSLFEQYSAGVPLFFPTPAFYAQLVMNGTVRCGSLYGPHIQEAMNLHFWLSRADFYDPNNFYGVYYYNSFEDCVRQLETFQDVAFYERRAHIQKRRADVLATWRKVFVTHMWSGIYYQNSNVSASKEPSGDNLEP